jgi:hypothetical protein
MFDCGKNMWHYMSLGAGYCATYVAGALETLMPNLHDALAWTRITHPSANNPREVK